MKIAIVRLRHWSAALLAATLLMLTAVPSFAQQTTGTPGSPDATTTIDGRYLPQPPEPFRGDINLNALQSKASWSPRVVPPKGAPNIVVILTDDVGFGAPSTFGGVIPTPTLDRIAANGHIGDAAGSPVDDKDYQIPFKFEGKINKLTYKLDRPKLTPEDIKKLEEANRQMQQK